MGKDRGLYRGKRIDTDDWIYGFYAKSGDKAYIIKDTDIAFAYVTVGEVVPETVCEFTGLKDNNGKKIFEGDIVKCTDANYAYDFTAVVLFGNPNGEYNWGFQLKRIGGAEANTDILLWVDMEDAGAYIEVVGNIHDNPELLKGEGE